MLWLTWRRVRRILCRSHLRRSRHGRRALLQRRANSNSSYRSHSLRCLNITANSRCGGCWCLRPCQYRVHSLRRLRRPRPALQTYNSDDGGVCRHYRSRYSGRCMFCGEVPLSSVSRWLWGPRVLGKPMCLDGIDRYLLASFQDIVAASQWSNASGSSRSGQALDAGGRSLYDSTSKC